MLLAGIWEPGALPTPAMLPNPAALIPASDLPTDATRHFRIRQVEIETPRETTTTQDSRVLFAVLRAAARTPEQIIRFSCEGLEIDAGSLAALNCFLRGGLAMGRMNHPWDRLPHAAHDTRYEWTELSAHLGLIFR